jgi:hypothetical protein
MSESDYYAGPVSCPPGCSSPPNNYSITNMYQGAIRQDTLLKKIYFMPPGETYDSLLYDFNLNLGDTLPPSYQTAGTLDSNFVTKIDSVLVGVNYRKRFWLTPINYWGGTDSNYVALIEGIGSTYGLLSELVPVFEAGCQLRCVYVDSMAVYSNTSESCANITTVSEKKDKLTSLIFPNPFSISTHIQFDISLVDAELSIYNLFGIKVREVKKITGKEIDIYRENLSAGIYFMKIVEGNKLLITNKLVIGD